MDVKSGPQKKSVDVSTTYKALDLTPPAHFDSEHVATWNELIHLIESSEHVVNIDRLLLEDLAVSIVIKRKAELAVNRDGLSVLGQKGNIVRHPLVSTIRDQQQTIFRITNALFLSPRSRATASLKEPASELPAFLEDNPQAQPSAVKAPWED